MKSISLSFLLVFYAPILFAQSNSEKADVDEERFFKPEAAYDLIGTKNDAFLLFVGDEVLKDSIVDSPVPELWKQLDAKVDFVIVFSDETEEAVSRMTSVKVVRAKGDYTDYFVKVWSSMKKWFLIEVKDGDAGSFTSTPEAYLLLSE